MKPILSIILLSFYSTLSAANYYYADLNSLSPTPPYTNWITAATNIQEAINQATTGDTVWVTNGTYYIDQEISVSTGVSLRSIEGASVTVIDAERASRCIYLQNGSFLDGFKITRGQISGNNGGAGVLCADSSCIVSNCIIISNLAPGGRGGGMSKGKAYDCLFSNNQAIYGGGIADLDAYDCTIRNNKADYGAGFKNSNAYNCFITVNYATRDGGGGRDGTAINCIITNNRADGNGGGLANRGTTARNCLIKGNFCDSEGGGIYIGRAINCTIVNNISRGNNGGGVVRGEVFNSIVWNNFGGDYLGSTTYRTCAQNVTPGLNGNITNAPLFRDESAADYRLSLTSPCVETGSNLWVSTATDLSGNERIFQRFSHRTNIVDMGAYEFTTSLLDDQDFDGRTYEQEYFDGTDPLDSGSCFRILLDFVDTNSVEIKWSTVPERLYDFSAYSNGLTNDAIGIYTNASFTQNSYTDTLYHAEYFGFYRVDINWPE